MRKKILCAGGTLLAIFAGAAGPLRPLIPLAMRECEDNAYCRIWSFNGTDGHADGADNMKAKLTVSSFTPDNVIIYRTDLPGSRFAGFTATYVGALHGNRIDGQVVYRWPGHLPHAVSGVWSAYIPASTRDQQALLSTPVPLSAAPSVQPRQQPAQQATVYNPQPSVGGSRYLKVITPQEQQQEADELNNSPLGLAAEVLQSGLQQNSTPSAPQQSNVGYNSYVNTQMGHESEGTPPP